MADYNYSKILERARSKLPEEILNKERFEIPKARGHIQGGKTIIANFNQIASSLGREQQQLLKYLQRELATPAEIDGPRLVLGRRINASLINAKIEQFAKEFVLCVECKKPDTKIIKEDKILILKCMVCGAKHPIRSKI
jgi:translation initiation factor 2 subunit 2